MGQLWKMNDEDDDIDDDIDCEEVTLGEQSRGSDNIVSL